MSRDRQEMLAILQHNTGFDEPALWADYAQSHSFNRVEAVEIARCPDCSAYPRRVWGQYVYYSTLIHLLECKDCGLVWADAHIDPDLVRAHFEVAYKGDEYFRERRNAIFEHLAAVIDGVAPMGARVLDIGGARGNLMHKAVVRRPDLHVTVQDISKTATALASTYFGFATLCGDAHELASHSEQYDVVVLSDVLYYEPNLKVLWSALSRLIRPGGAIVTRIPNKFLLLRLGQLWYQLSHRRGQRLLQDRVRFFNPEHIFIFRRRYLDTRLRSLGFTQVRAVPSPLMTDSMPAATRAACFCVASIANRLSRRTLVLTPSMLVVGTRRQPTDSRA